MRILHTADWHLGKKLELCERTEEHQCFLNWLIRKLDEEKIEVLVIAGDIFDTGAPSNTALQQYYRFLTEVKSTGCREVVIIGGNHDSISTLNAPKELLRVLNVHVIGGVPDAFEDQVIEIRNAAGEPGLVICAVPFLRDKDIRLSVSGENAEERERRIKEGIANHYHQFRPLIASYKTAGIPVIATGHLFAAGSSTSDSEKDIHVGNLGQVAGDQFPQEFDYVALGHIHRPQVVNKMNYIRYSGSPIHLSFSETDDRKQVLILDFQEGRMDIEEHEVPCHRKLLRIKGDLETVRRQVLALEDPQTTFGTWVEVQVLTESPLYDLDEQLEAIRLKRRFIERFFSRQSRTRVVQNLDEQSSENTSLDELEPKEVFIKKCETEFGTEDYSDLLETFDLALEQMTQKEVAL